LLACPCLSLTLNTTFVSIFFLGMMNLSFGAWTSMTAVIPGGARPVQWSGSAVGLLSQNWAVET